MTTKIEKLRDEQIKNIKEMADRMNRIHDNWNGIFNEYATENILNEMEWRVNLLVPTKNFNNFAEKAKEISRTGRAMTADEIIEGINKLAELADNYNNVKEDK